MDEAATTMEALDSRANLPLDQSIMERGGSGYNRQEGVFQTKREDAAYFQTKSTAIPANMAIRAVPEP